MGVSSLPMLQWCPLIPCNDNRTLDVYRPQFQAKIKPRPLRDVRYPRHSCRVRDPDFPTSKWLNHYCKSSRTLTQSGSVWPEVGRGSCFICIGIYPIWSTIMHIQA